MDLPPVTDEEMLECITELTKSTCHIINAFSRDCINCPSQRDIGGCVLRIYRNQLKKKVIEEHETAIKSLTTNIHEFEMQINAHTWIIEKINEG